jgi:hypothetical protein
MSVAATSAILNSSLPVMLKMIAVVLADHADPTGGHMRPSVDRVARMASTSRRTVQRVLKKLVKDGVLLIEEEAGRYRATTYQFSQAIMALSGMGANVSPMATVSPMKASKGVTGGAHGRQAAPVMGDRAVSPEPTPRTVVEPKTTASPPPPPLHGGAAAPEVGIFSAQDEWEDVEPIHDVVVEAQMRETLLAWAKAPWGTPEALAHMYNQETPDNVPGIVTLSPRRRQRAQALLKLYPDRHWWVEVFLSYARSRFLSGLSKPTPGHEKWKADFDWLLANGKDGGIENVVRVHDGAYDD